MFRWKPEGRYRSTKYMAIAPFWFLNGTSLKSINALLALSRFLHVLLIQAHLKRLNASKGNNAMNSQRVLYQKIKEISQFSIYILHVDLSQNNSPWCWCSPYKPKHWKHTLTLMSEQEERYLINAWYLSRWRLTWMMIILPSFFLSLSSLSPPLVVTLLFPKTPIPLDRREFGNVNEIPL